MCSGFSLGFYFSFPMPNDVEHLLLCIFAIGISSVINYHSNIQIHSNTLTLSFNRYGEK